jgi:hypothetical protein
VGQRDTDIDARLQARAKDVRTELDRLLGEARRRYQQSQPRHPLRRPAVVAVVAAAVLAGATLVLLRGRSRRGRLAGQVARLRQVPTVVSRALAS